MKATLALVCSVVAYATTSAADTGVSDGFWNHFDRQAAPTPALELNEVVLDYLHPDEATTLLTWCA